MVSNCPTCHYGVKLSEVSNGPRIIFGIFGRSCFWDGGSCAVRGAVDPVDVPAVRLPGLSPCCPVQEGPPLLPVLQVSPSQLFTNWSSPKSGSRRGWTAAGSASRRSWTHRTRRWRRWSGWSDCRASTGQEAAQSWSFYQADSSMRPSAGHRKISEQQQQKKTTTTENNNNKKQH